MYALQRVWIRELKIKKFIFAKVYIVLLTSFRPFVSIPGLQDGETGVGKDIVQLYPKLIPVRTGAGNCDPNRHTSQHRVPYSLLQYRRVRTFPAGRPRTVGRRDGRGVVLRVRSTDRGPTSPPHTSSR